MPKWMISSNYIGRIVYQVYRKIDETKVDHSGNREYIHQIFDTREEAQKMIDQLNKEEKGYAKNRI